MPLPQLTFSYGTPKPDVSPLRADVPLFVGLVARRDVPLPEAQTAWLEQSDWKVGDEAGLLGIPVPIDSFAEFAAIFAWEDRPVEDGSVAKVATRLGLAVRHFFAQGGARCYVVRAGDPLPLLGPDSESAETGQTRYAKLLDWHTSAAPDDADQRVPLLPGLVDISKTPHPQWPDTWRGAGQIFAVDQAVMLSLPDLPDLISGPSHRLPEVRTPPAGEEKFVECASPIPGIEPDPNAIRPDYAAPRLTLSGYSDWARAIRHALTMLEGNGSAAHRRDVMVLAALPLPDLTDPEMPSDAQAWPLSLAAKALPGPADSDLPPLFSSSMVGSGRVQLAWPWLISSDSIDQPEGAIGGEGALAGAIAKSTLSNGLHRSAAGKLSVPPRTTMPELPQLVLRRVQREGAYGWLGDCCSLFAPRNGQIRLISDVTTSQENAWREASSSRIMGALLRQSSLLGQELAFAPNGQESWRKVRRTLERLLEIFRANGALASRGSDPAYSVRCDASTMQRHDLDQGRMIAKVSFCPSRTLQHIHVALDMRGVAA